MSRLRNSRLVGPVLVVSMALGLQMVLWPPAARGATPAKPYDFNGDGYVDLAIGVPRDGKIAAGSVNILYGSKKGLTAQRAQLWSQASRGIKGSPSESEHFGGIMTSGDFDCDRRGDLAVGNETKIAVLYGGRRGLTSRDQLIGAGLGVFEGSARRIEHLTAGDFDADGCSELAVAGEGGLVVLRGTRSGLHGAERLALPVSTSEPGQGYQGAVAGDLTGDRIADLVVGGAAPSGAVDPGVVVVPGSTGGLLPGRSRWYPAPQRPEPAEQPFFSSYFGASLAIGDMNGDGQRDLAIGDPGAGRETYYNDYDEPRSCPSWFGNCSGAVVVLAGTGTGLSLPSAQLWSKASLGREHQLGLGLALSAGDVNADGRDDLAIGEYGAVTVLRGSSSGLTKVGSRQWHWDTLGVKGQEWDRHGNNGPFGCGIVRLLDHGRGGAADLSVGSIGYRTSTGAVSVLYGSAAGTTTSGDQLWRQSSPGVPGKAQTGDEFGGVSTCYVEDG